MKADNGGWRAGSDRQRRVKEQTAVLGSEPGWSGRRTLLCKNQGRTARRWQFVGRLWVLD